MRRPGIAVLGVVALALAGCLAGCGVRDPVPPTATNDARFGRLAGSAERPSKERMCRSWRTAIVARDTWADSHVSFPEADVESACFTPVSRVASEADGDGNRGGRVARPGATPRGCAYPSASTRARLEALADELEALALDSARPHRLFPCTLSAAQRAAASLHDARALRAAARDAATHPYAAVVVPGHGLREQERTLIADFVPGGACRALADGDERSLGAMPERAERAAEALRGGVAPLAIVSGGAVHSRAVEAFALMHLLQCKERILPTRIIVEPCAEHTHTNLRNSARWLHAMDARAAYLLTDAGIQSEYFQDFSGFEFILGSIDQRSLRDWGYVIGSWRQASLDDAAGFWFTPYRFWAEPRDGLGSVTCVDDH